MNSKHWLLQIVIAILVVSCSSQELLDDRYQPAGGAVLRANKLLRLKYPSGIPSGFTSEQYKDVLREGAPSFAPALEPFDVRVVQSVDGHFAVFVLDNEEIFLFQLSCITASIHCWVYKGQCDPEEGWIDLCAAIEMIHELPARE